MHKPPVCMTFGNLKARSGNQAKAGFFYAGPVRKWRDFFRMGRAGGKMDYFSFAVGISCSSKEKASSSSRYSLARVGPQELEPMPLWA